MKKCVETVDLDIIGADPEHCGLKGSPTIVAATEKVGEIGGNCQMYEGHSAENMVREALTTISLKELLTT
jgi:electron transfer flavoprotein beta subunit